MFFKKNLRISKSVSIFAILIVILLILSITPIYGQVDFDSFLGTSISDVEIDGVIGNEWEDAGKYSSIALEPTGTAEIWTKHDGTYLYIAIEFIADSSNPWVGIQFERTTHMASGADGAIFGNDNIGANEYRDTSFGGFGSITSDTKQDGVGVIKIGTSNLVTIELKKPLSSGDSAGSDIDWNVDVSYSLIIIWDSNGGGSSGGSSGHSGSPTLNKTIFINPSVIPEFSVLTVFVAIIAIPILGLIFIKKLSNS